MKKITGFLILFINCFYFAGIAQSDFITVYKQRIPISDLKITHNMAQYTAVKTGRNISIIKSDVSSIEFQNGIKIVYEKTKAAKISSSQYNATINLNDGGFFTAFVDSIKSDRVYYHKFSEATVLQIDINLIQFITYIDGLRENIISQASIAAIKKMETAPPMMAVESRKDRVSYIGLTAGLSNAWFEEEGYLQTRSGRNGMMIGFNFERQFSKIAGVNLGLRYEQKGSVYTSDSLISTYNLHYLTLPVSYRLYVSKENFKAFFDGGFYFGFLLPSDFELENTNSKTTVTADFNDPNFDLNHVDFGPSIGLGFSYRKNAYQFTAGAQYNLGFITVRDGDYYAYPDYYSFATQNRNITCYFTFGFDIKGHKQAKYMKNLIH